MCHAANDTMLPLILQAPNPRRPLSSSHADSSSEAFVHEQLESGLEPSELRAVLLRQLEMLDKEQEAVAARQAEIGKMESIVHETHASLEKERQKALLLVGNFSPPLADLLQREFPP